MGFMGKKVDDKTASQIAADIAQIDGESVEEDETTEDVEEPKVKLRSSVASLVCECVTSSAYGREHPGLLNENTICPKCGGTGKVAKLG